jgi:hypothetical protein
MSRRDKCRRAPECQYREAPPERRGWRRVALGRNGRWWRRPTVALGCAIVLPVWGWSVRTHDRNVWVDQHRVDVERVGGEREQIRVLASAQAVTTAKVEQTARLIEEIRQENRRRDEFNTYLLLRLFGINPGDREQRQWIEEQATRKGLNPPPGR